MEIYKLEKRRSPLERHRNKQIVRNHGSDNFLQ
jgi:hypothetical protein